ncbi:MAG: VOC family protein [Acidimicrobiales bacterium]
MRLESVTVDAVDPVALAEWWAGALGWVVVDVDESEVVLAELIEADGGHRYPELLFLPVAEPEAGQERIHLDLNSHSLVEQQAIVDRLVAMGAVPADVGQAADALFVVLADPEGNNFCVLDPRTQYAHLGSLAGFTLAAHDASALKELWAAATGWDVARDDGDYVVLTSPDAVAPMEIITRPTMPDDDRKDRIHLDVAPGPDEDQAGVVASLETLGARRVDIGQGDVGWVVLTDPEGNEFCVLTPRP